MATITGNDVITGIKSQNKKTHKNVSMAVANLVPEVDELLEMAAYLFTDVGQPGSPVDLEYLNSVVLKFNEQADKLSAVMAKINSIRGLADPDPVAAAQKLNDLVTANGFDPSTYTDRFKD